MGSLLLSMSTEQINNFLCFLVVDLINTRSLYKIKSPLEMPHLAQQWFQNPLKNSILTVTKNHFFDSPIQ